MVALEGQMIIELVRTIAARFMYRFPNNLAELISLMREVPYVTVVQVG